MNIILFSNEDLIKDNTIELKDRRLDHIKNIHKPVLGQILCIGEINGQIGQGTVTRLENHSIQLEIDLATKPPSPTPIRLLLALPRPKNLARILQTVTTLGIKEIIIFHSYQVEKSFWQSDLLSETKTLNSLHLGLEQAKDTILPKVSFHRYFRPFVEDITPQFQQDSICLVAHPSPNSTTTSLKINTPPPHNFTTLAIGPEGGFIPYEVEKFKEQGFTIMGLGERILKVETAITASIAQLML